MGFFDTTWTVEFEYSESFLASYKKGAIKVEASSEYQAISKAKGILKAQYKFVKSFKAYKGTSNIKYNEVKPTVETFEKKYDASLNQSKNSYETSSHKNSSSISYKKIYDDLNKINDLPDEKPEFKKYTIVPIVFSIVFSLFVILGIILKVLGNKSLTYYSTHSSYYSEKNIISAKNAISLGNGFLIAGLVLIAIVWLIWVIRFVRKNR